MGFAKSLAVGTVALSVFYGCILTSFALYDPVGACQAMLKTAVAGVCENEATNPFVPGKLMWWLMVRTYVCGAADSLRVV